MTKQKLNWKRFGLRSLLLVMFLAAMFFGGYQLGYKQGRDSWGLEPVVWEEVGGPGWLPGTSFTTTGCTATVEDNSTDNDSQSENLEDTAKKSDQPTNNQDNPQLAEEPNVNDPLETDPFDFGDNPFE